MEQPIIEQNITKDCLKTQFWSTIAISKSINHS